MLRAFDPALPLERPLSESLTIYRKRLAILTGVVLTNAVLLAFLYLGEWGLVFILFPVLAMSWVLVVTLMLKIRDRHSRENP
jgi:hypothetical protein